MDVDLKSSILKPKHGKVMCQKYEYLDFEKEESITFSSWKTAGIGH